VSGVSDPDVEALLIESRFPGEGESKFVTTFNWRLPAIARFGNVLRPNGSGESGGLEFVADESMLLGLPVDVAFGDNISWVAIGAKDGIGESCGAFSDTREPGGVPWIEFTGEASGGNAGNFLLIMGLPC